MKLIERRCSLTVVSLAMIAGGIGLVLISLPSEGHTAKSVSEADIKKIDDIMQTAVNGARQRLRDLGGPISPRLPLSTRLMSRRLRAERRYALS